MPVLQPSCHEHLAEMHTWARDVAGEGTMEQNQTKLLIPALRPLYEWAEPAFINTFPVRLDRARLRVSPHVGPDHARVALRGGGPYSLDGRLGREL